jgi:hypothetical protein
MAGIDRDYWLEFAKEEVTNSIANRERSAEKLDLFLAWVWGIYTSIFVLASFLNLLSSNIWQLISVAQPILIIMLARFYCTIVSMPSTNDDQSVSADPNDVASIIDGFKLIVKDKKRKLRYAKLLSLLSIFSLTASLIGYNYFDSTKAIKYEFQVKKLKKDINSQEIVVISDLEKINDSIELATKNINFQILNKIKKKELDCILNENFDCLDSLKILKDKLNK